MMLPNYLCEDHEVILITILFYFRPWITVSHASCCDTVTKYRLIISLRVNSSR